MGLIHGCRIAIGAPYISHLPFTNDCYLFFRANETKADAMKNILQRYASISGQIVNFNKSGITLSVNTAMEDRAVVCEKPGVQDP